MQRNTISLIIIITILSIFINCSNSKPSAIKSVEFNGTDNVSFISCISEISLCPLETAKEYLIGDNPDLRVMNDDYYVIDSRGSKEVYRFDDSGAFINKIGKTGRAENEYPSMSSVYIHNDSILIASGDNKLFSYRQDGDIRSIKSLGFHAEASICSEDGLWCYLGHKYI